jgi:hypothetical protein
MFPWLDNKNFSQKWKKFAKIVRFCEFFFVFAKRFVYECFTSKKGVCEVSRNEISQIFTPKMTFVFWKIFILFRENSATFPTLPYTLFVVFAKYLATVEIFGKTKTFAKLRIQFVYFCFFLLRWKKGVCISTLLFKCVTIPIIATQKKI